MNMKEKDIFMCIFKVFNWMLFFIVINTILTVRITKNYLKNTINLLVYLILILILYQMVLHTLFCIRC